MLRQVCQPYACSLRQRESLLLAASLRHASLYDRGEFREHSNSNRFPRHCSATPLARLSTSSTAIGARELRGKRDVVSLVGSDSKSRSRQIHTCGVLCDAKLVELTSVRYPETKRGDFNVITEEHLEAFRSVLGNTRVITDESDVESYNVDWMRMVRGAGRVVLKPKTTDEVAAILKYCNANKLAVCPQGGNTGLVGGSVPVFDEVILSTSLMNDIISVDTLSGVLVCQAGCVLETLEAHLNDRGLMMPLDLGAKGSCQVGGNVSTNAGGVRLLRYGSLQGSILGIEAVTANGEIIDCLSTLKKDNTGYHLKHLFVGSEGTLGVVTKVAIQCPISPKAINVAFLGLNSFTDVLSTFSLAKTELGEILSSCEMMDLSSLEAATQNLHLHCPIGGFPFYMLIETSGSNADHDEEKLGDFLEAAMGRGIVQDGTVASEPSRVKLIWEIRERIPEGFVRDGFFFMYDVSLPLAHFYEIVPLLAAKLVGSPAIRCCGFGHLGDGNLHLNITAKEFDHGLMDLIEPFVYEWTSKLRGSVSSEHGIGFKKTKFIHFSKSASSLNLMKQIKTLMDPNGILNPYKVLPQ